MAHLKFTENGLRAMSVANEKIGQGVREIYALLQDYRQSLTTLIENAKTVDGLAAEMAKTATAIMRALPK